MRCRWITLLSIILLTVMFSNHGGSSAQAEELTLHMEVIGPEAPSPYKSQLRLQVTNESFTDTPLLEKLKSSELLMDDHPYKRIPVSFDGPVGLPAKGFWEGCFPFEDYAPQGVPPGTHHFQWHLGGALTEKIRYKLPPAAPPASTPKERLRQVEALKKAFVPGLLQSCVQNWLTEKDGGLASTGEVRYYVDPGVKVLVPYDQSSPEPRISGPVRVYLESRVAD